MLIRGRRLLECAAYSDLSVNGRCLKDGGTYFKARRLLEEIWDGTAMETLRDCMKTSQMLSRFFVKSFRTFNIHNTLG